MPSGPAYSVRGEPPLLPVKIGNRSSFSPPSPQPARTHLYRVPWCVDQADPGKMPFVQQRQQWLENILFHLLERGSTPLHVTGRQGLAGLIQPDNRLIIIPG